MNNDTSLARIEGIARAAMDDLPPAFAKGAADLVLRVVERPQQAQLHALNIRDPLDLTGLYEGIPVTHKSVFDQPEGPDIVWLFRAPILAELATRPNETLERLVTHVTVHEVAHHFGWSDADIASVDRWWE